MENEDYIELAGNIELVDLTNEETVWVETEDIDNIYSEEPMVENDWYWKDFQNVVRKSFEFFSNRSVTVIDNNGY
ncbi:3002_t:CDS:2 [Dentiscutata heterogama]|uniref:3002_t:CDS:1 n=1 Tax=Dentiscutata heterogama TaxID=1316150 RepID=A0ACA9LYY8_9GLOM|nr:3002_t:CDS:2 [Dentiscutata heterogama]